MNKTKKKIAILGGGMGSLSAAYWLTTAPGWQDHYEITLYQMGWRLGGKAASSRNPDFFHRNEEHGYHMLFGFYHNTFRTMRDCYDELGRGPNAPLSQFIAETPEDEARYPHRYAMRRNNKLFLAQQYNGGVERVALDFPSNDLLPGDGDIVNLPTCLEMAWQWLWKFDEARRMPDDKEATSTGLGQWWDGGVEDMETIVKRMESLVSGAVRGMIRPRSQKPMAVGDLIRKLPRSGVGGEEPGPISRMITGLVRDFLRDLWEELKPTVHSDWHSYYTWVFADVVGTVMIGVIEDDLFNKGFDSINDINYYDWIRRHATVPEGTELTVGSTLVQFAYDACFAYRNGDEVSPATADKPLMGSSDMEAGMLLRGQIRLLLTYKGSVDWLFQAGAGEVLVAPMYEVLRRRGVKFRFFHKVTRMVVSDDGGAIEAVEMEEQAHLKVGEYQPLVVVHDLPVWPSEPLYDQLVEGAELKSKAVNLESFWTDWKGTPKTLTRGVDFDDLLLGIPVGSFPYIAQIAQDLMNVSPAWKEMVDQVKTTRTVSFQTWMNKSLEEMGWQRGKLLTGTGAGAVNMEADATHTIDMENWPADRKPVNLTFFGGVMQDDPAEPHCSDTLYPATQDEAAKENSLDFLRHHAGIYWPLAQTPDGFRWDWLASLHSPDAQGEKRFDEQYWRANIDPSERYVLSVVGSTRYRLTAGGSGFDNLYLAGDWIRTGLNCGCMEATVMSGMQASSALSSYPQRVPGENDFWSDSFDNRQFRRAA